MFRLFARVIGATSFSALILALLPACSEVNDGLGIFQDDVEIVSETTVDVERENMESGVLGVVEAMYLPVVQLPLFTALDEASSAAISCVSGRLERASSAPEQGQYSAGDYLNLRYENCMQANGDVYDGELKLRYNAVRGLNKRFTKIDTLSCIAALNKRADQTLNVVENRNAEGEYFPADALRITKQREGSQLEFLKLVSSNGSEDQVASVIQRVALDDNALVLHRAVVLDEARSNVDRQYYKLKEGVYPSLDGDQLYTIAEGLGVRESCQQYDRRLSASAESFSVALMGGRKLVLNGELTLFQGSADFEAITQNIESSDYQVTVFNENRRSDYQLKRSELISVRSADNTGAARYIFSALLSSEEFPGAYAVSTNSPILADLATLAPRAGGFSAIGRDRDQLNATFLGAQVTMTAATEGDTNGNGAPNNNVGFTTFWSDLLNRDFVVFSESEQ